MAQIMTPPVHTATGPLGTFADWLAVDPTLAALGAKFRQWYGSQAHQLMDRTTLDLRINALSAPTVVDAPYVGQEGDQLTCTMDNWNGEPTSYAYQWQRDGTNIGTGEASYAVTAPDVGHTFTCILTASNAGGSASSTSNAVVAA